MLLLAGALLLAPASYGCALEGNDGDEDVSVLEDPLTTMTLECKSRVKDDGVLWAPDVVYESTVSLRYVRSANGATFTSMRHSNSVQHRTNVQVRSSARPADSELLNESFYKYERSGPPIVRNIRFSAPSGATLTIRTTYDRALVRDPASSCTVIVP